MNAQVDYFIHGSENIECYLQRLDNNKVYLHMINGEFQLNDKLIANSSNNQDNADSLNEGVELKNGDVLLIGDLNMFKFFSPSENGDFLASSLSKKNSLKSLVKNYFSNIKKYEFLDGQTKALNEKLQECESIIDRQRKSIDQLREQIEDNIMEINQLKDSNENKKENDIENSMQNLVEKFERDEKLLNECLQNLKKSQETQLKSFIFELQNLKFRDQELDMELKRNKNEIEKV